MKRRQASLFLSYHFQIESLRIRYNPAQARLIPAHVTLCREDEVADWKAFQAKLESLCPFEISLTFGAPVREGDFVFLPVCEGLDIYHAFRRQALSEGARSPNPHITLIHPRNGSCTDQAFADISATIASPLRYTFREVRLIEEGDDGVWRVFSRIGRADESG